MNPPPHQYVFLQQCPTQVKALELLSMVQAVEWRDDW